MELLWDSAPKTLMELVSALAGSTGWSKSTVATMLSRMEDKGLVRYETAGRARQYFPCIPREEAAVQPTPVQNTAAQPSGVQPTAVQPSGVQSTTEEAHR